jgi:hypothetical protein
MDSIAQTTPARKAYYCHLDDAHGVLTQDDTGAIWFRDSETDALTLITPEHTPFLSVHGEIGVANAQYLADQRHGGYVALAARGRDIAGRAA